MNEIQPRYAAFLKMGCGKNHEFLAFISEVKKAYLESGLNGEGESIRDHDLFTSFIEGWVDGAVSNSFCIRFKGDK